MSPTSSRNMRWSAVVGALALVLSGAGNARAEKAAKGNVTAAGVGVAVDADKPVNFKGLSLDVSFTDASGLYAGMEAYQNVGAITLQPAWHAGAVLFKDVPALKHLSVGLTWALSGEFAGTGEQYRTGNIDPAKQFDGCFAGGTGNGGLLENPDLPYCQGGSDRRLDYSDIVYKIIDDIYVIPVVKIKVGAALAGGIPVSAESRATGFRTSLQPQVGASRTFFDKKLKISYAFGFTKYFYESNVAVFNDDSAADPYTDPRNPQLGTHAVSTDNLNLFATNPGGTNPSFSLVHEVSVSFAPTDKFTLAVHYAIADRFDQAFGCTADTGSTSGKVDVCKTGRDVADASGATTEHRGDHGVQQFTVAADYQIFDYLTAELALVTAAPQRKGNDSWQEPFFTADYNNYTTLNFGLTVSTDGLLAKVLHKS